MCRYLNTAGDLAKLLDNGRVLDGEQIARLGEILGVQHLTEQAPHHPLPTISYASF